ncbi:MULTISPECIES: hypothetical protein [Actinomycetes]|uniref:hypothetical protein n=1 Tax=Actinomycetes TaxID=1760 RepID=UPI0012DEF7C6|nr:MULTISPECIES: hypothetical protein [Actinomycetes]
MDVEYAFLDDNGYYHDVPSEYGSKLYVRVRLAGGDDGKAKPTCAATVTNQSIKKVATKTTIKFGVDGDYFGDWTTKSLKPGTYNIDLSCKDARSKDLTQRHDTVAVVDSDPVSITGTLSCIDPQKRRTKPVDVYIYNDLQAGNPKLSSTSGPAKGYTSKFIFTTYGGGDYTVNVMCGGTKKKPQSTVTAPGTYGAGSYNFVFPYTPGQDAVGGGPA